MGRYSNRGGRRKGGKKRSERKRSYKRNSRGRYSKRRSAPQPSGNDRERISMESGELVIIDQFMIANPTVSNWLIENIECDDEKRDLFISEYGGLVVKLDRGQYRIDRDPYKCQIILYPADMRNYGDIVESSDFEEIGDVYVDTRCIAFIDKELLYDDQLLKTYNDKWFLGEEKACRDLLRDNGGAVRYGFNRNGDILSVSINRDNNIILMKKKDVVTEEGLDEGLIEEDESDNSVGSDDGGVLETQDDR